MTTSAPCTSTIVKLDLGYVSFETTCTPTMVCGALALCTLEIDLAIEEDVPLVVFVVVLPTHDARWSAVAARVARDRGDSVCVGVAPPHARRVATCTSRSRFPCPTTRSSTGPHPTAPSERSRLDRYRSCEYRSRRESSARAVEMKPAVDDATDDEES